MDIESLETAPFTIPDEMLSRGVPVLYVDDRCSSDDQMILRQPDGIEYLVKITDNGPQKLKELSS
ncbi:hypothetical protein GCM10011332_06190 [Terasakiella brassicae]|uniref:Uncharacterized protein n=1 Tax=Terasakiella brassicae TaxID=1634917 RepID=A0A917BSZ4_9PROT|nr:hypothetical protein [Terasakiella brassicae]GGF55548.1 hypothetical protein GCM10011332_06190 [Terasakiella brassicae]